MTSIARLETRLDTWRSFRDIAHAARTLAATQSMRWAGRVVESARHLAWCDALARLWPAPAGPPHARVVVGIGTDLGLCGRLNPLVAEALAAHLESEAGALVITVGERLVREPGPYSGAGPHFPAPSSFAAVEALAGRLDRLLCAISRDVELRLVIVLARETSPTGSPVVTAWDGAPPGLPAQPEAAAATRRPLVSLVPAAQGRRAAAGLLLHARLVHALCTGAASEATARLRRMTQAVETSDRRIGEQELALRELKREAMTQEMLEVLGGRRARPLSPRD